LWLSNPIRKQSSLLAPGTTKIKTAQSAVKILSSADARDDSRIFDPVVLRSISKLKPPKTTNGDFAPPQFLEAV
jgi:hypothetical protein